MTHPYNCLKHADFIGRFENLIEDWGRVCARIGIPDRLPHKNKSKPYEVKIPNNVVTDLKRFYIEDFEQFYPDEY